MPCAECPNWLFLQPVKAIRLLHNIKKIPLRMFTHAVVWNNHIKKCISSEFQVLGLTFGETPPPWFLPNILQDIFQEDFLYFYEIFRENFMKLPWLVLAVSFHPIFYFYSEPPKSRKISILGAKCQIFTPARVQVQVPDWNRVNVRF